MKNVIKVLLLIVLKIVGTVVVCGVMTFIPLAIFMAVLHAVDMDKEAYQFWGIVTAVVAVPAVLGVLGGSIADLLPSSGTSGEYVSNDYDDSIYDDDDEDSYSFFDTGKKRSFFDEDEDEYLWGPEDYAPHLEDPDPWENPGLYDD